MTKYLLLAPSMIAYAIKTIINLAIYLGIMSLYPVAWVWGVSLNKYHSDASYVAFPEEMK